VWSRVQWDWEWGDATRHSRETRDYRVRAGCRAETVLRGRRRPDPATPRRRRPGRRDPPPPRPPAPAPRAGEGQRGGRGRAGPAAGAGGSVVRTKRSSSFLLAFISSLEPRKQYISHLCMHIAHVHVVCFESTVIGLCLPVRRGVRLCAQCGVAVRRDPGPCVPAYARAPQESPESATTHTATIRVH
jgi:hypothetical protein